MIRHELRVPRTSPTPGTWVWALTDGLLYLEDANGVSTLQGVGPRLVADDVEGMGYPEVDVFSREAPRLPGRVRTGTRAKERQAFLPIVFEAKGSDWMTLQRKFWAMLSPDRPVFWRVYDPVGAWRELPVWLDPSDTSYSHDPSIITHVEGVSLIADSVFWLGPEQVIATGSDNPDVPFFGPANAAPPFYLMPGQSSGGSSFEMLGDVDSWPVFRARNVTGFTLTDGTSLVAGPLLNPYTYELDFDPTARVLVGRIGSLVHNATANMTARQFFPVRSGVPIAVTVDGGTGEARLVYRPKYWRAV